MQQLMLISILLTATPAAALQNSKRSAAPDDPPSQLEAIHHKQSAAAEVTRAIYGEANIYPEHSRTRQNVNDVSLPALGRTDLFNYVPDRNVVLCACAKCGSTSFFKNIYQLEFGQSWQWGDSWPYAQNTTSERWKNKVSMIDEPKRQDEVFESAYSFALIRDPKERLVSAWKSKVACDLSYGVDQHDRSYFVYDEHMTPWPRGFVFGIQRLYGAEENFTCMDLPTFVDALVEIKKLGRSKYLDQHFLPQNEGCFYRHPAKRWSRVATISQQDAFDELSQKMGARPLPVFDRDHSSMKKVRLSKELVDKLDMLTKEEYEMLAPFLPDGYSSPITAGQYVIQTKRSHPHLADLLDE